MSDPAHKEINPLVNAEDQSGAGQPLRYANDPDPEKAPERPSIKLPEVNSDGDFETRCRRAAELCEEAFAMTGSWVVFFREMLGRKGVVAKLFPDQEERQAFIQREEYATVQEALAAVRSQDQSKSDAAEPERMITIRIPRSLHEVLQDEADECSLSINKLAISKLLQPVNPRFVPEQRGRRRGRRPGPQGTREKHNQAANSNASSEATSHDRLSERGGSPERGSVHRWADPIGNQSRERR